MIQEKLSILQTSGIIDATIYDYLQKVINHLEEQNISKESAEVFLVHLAMASARQQRGENVNNLDAIIATQIKEDTNYLQAKNLWKELSNQAPVTFHENEIDYFYLHICTMLAES